MVRLCTRRLRSQLSSLITKEATTTRLRSHVLILARPTVVRRPAVTSEAPSLWAT